MWKHAFIWQPVCLPNELKKVCKILAVDQSDSHEGVQDNEVAVTEELVVVSLLNQGGRISGWQSVLCLSVRWAYASL